MLAALGVSERLGPPNRPLNQVDTQGYIEPNGRAGVQCLPAS